MEAPDDFQEGIGRPLPNKFRRGLDSLNVDYPGCEGDLFAAHEAIDKCSKRDFLRAFRILKGKQIAYEHYQEVESSDKSIVEELDYPGSEADKRELQTWFHENPPTRDNIRIFNERIEGLRNKDAAVRGNRSHPNIAALLKLKLNYPGCEDDVKEALQVHYSRPLTRFPDKLHSLKAKQELFLENRSHWRLAQLDDIEVTYPNGQRDVDAVVDWHIYNAPSRENDILFHEIIEGILEKEAMYLEWVYERRFPGSNPAEATNADSEYSDDSRNQSSDERDDDSFSNEDTSYEDEWGLDNSSFDKFYVGTRDHKSSKQLRYSDEEREPNLNHERS